MTVRELIESLEDIDGGVEVKLALQPSYPMEGHIRNICVEKNEDGDEKAVWIACSDNEGYGVPREVWNESEIYPEDNDYED